MTADTFMEQEREAARDAREQEDGRDDDRRATRREAEADEHYRVEDDVYRGICGGCERPVSAFAGDEGGHEGSCLWRGGPWHPSCQQADRTAEAVRIALSGARS